MKTAINWAIQVLPMTGEPMAIPGGKPLSDQCDLNVELIELAKILTVIERTLGLGTSGHAPE